VAETIAIKTRLYTEKDDLPEFVHGYVKDIAGSGDIVAVAQKLASISQERIVYAPEMKVSFLARIICKFVNPASSQHSPQGMQAAFNEAGYFRVTLAAIVGGITRLFGRKGDFYRIAGEKVTIIDDAGDGTGTIPPYNKYVILAPEEPDDLAESIKAKTGVDTAIMDCSYVASTTLGASAGVDRYRVAELLKSNPFGNFDEMTPIVVIKNP
jgi:F420-0:gamma-glutamyl ligase